MMAMKGSMLITSTEMLMPAICNESPSASETPKRNEPSTTPSGLPRASMAMTIAMNPWPWVMKGVKTPATEIAR